MWSAPCPVNKQPFSPLSHLKAFDFMIMSHGKKGSVTQRSDQAPLQALAQQALIYGNAVTSTGLQVSNFCPSQKAIDEASRVLTYMSAEADLY